MMGHLNTFSASGWENLNKHFPKIEMPGGLPGGMLKLRFDWYINYLNSMSDIVYTKIIKFVHTITVNIILFNEQKLKNAGAAVSDNYYISS